MLDPTSGRTNSDGLTGPTLGSPSDPRPAFGAVRGALRSTTDLPRLGVGAAKSQSPARPDRLPAYLEDNYRWAYLRPASLKIFDRNLVVSAILWGCYGRLKRAAFVELEPGQKVLQAACVYGDFSTHLAGVIGPEGSLDIIDIVPLQVANSRRKLRRFPHAQVRVADAAEPGGGPHEVVYCFFLLHELPDQHKRHVIDALLDQVTPGGKVVFVDYHQPVRLHPLKALMGAVFDRLEPFAKALWRREISSFATSAEEFTWRKETYFGGLYQKVVAARRQPSDENRSAP